MVESLSDIETSNFKALLAYHFLRVSRLMFEIRMFEISILA